MGLFLGIRTVMVFVRGEGGETLVKELFELFNS